MWYLLDRSDVPEDPYRLQENKLGLGGRLRFGRGGGGLITVTTFQKRECCRKWLYCLRGEHISDLG